MRLRPSAAGAVLAIAIALSCGGCGLAAGAGSTAVSLTVTQAFGIHHVGTITSRRIPGSETVMRMLEHYYRVSTSNGGGFVDSIDGLGRSGSSVNWFYYVNGVRAPQGPAGTSVRSGDHIWWDLHDSSATHSVPAVVGSFPEPFTTGIAGKRYPVTIECGSGLSPACNRVTSELVAEHVPAAPQLLGTGSGPDTLGIVVGTWSQIRSQVASQLVAYGPSASGVYARFARNGSSLLLLNPAGRVVRTLGAGAGLIAATADSQSVPTWLITGTDAAGVEAAARALTPRALRDHFAVAVDGSTQLPVPIAP
jgi:hypothetical protein